MMLRETPAETDPRYFRTWQRVSLELQKRLRTAIPDAYFRDTARYGDRAAAHQWVVYAACREFYGRPRTEFAYDVADPATLPSALRAIGKAVRTVLAGIAKRLHEAGNPELARRYAPVWYQDILRAVQKKPKRLITFLACESVLINAVIDWGTMRTPSAEKRFLKAVVSAARVYGVDGQVISDVMDGVNDILNSGILEYSDAVAAGGPDARVG
jgi:hypothetical protein